MVEEKETPEEGCPKHVIDEKKVEVSISPHGTQKICQLDPV